MVNYAEGVNPRILRWARERSGYSLEEIAEAFHKEVEEISDWEQGRAVPTYNQLERLAYTFYKRPIALFSSLRLHPNQIPRNRFALFRILRLTISNPIPFMLSAKLRQCRSLFESWLMDETQASTRFSKN